MAIWEARAWWTLDRVRGSKLESDWWHGDSGYQRIYWIGVEGEAMWVFEERGQFPHGWF